MKVLDNSILFNEWESWPFPWGWNFCDTSRRRVEQFIRVEMANSHESNTILFPIVLNKMEKYCNYLFIFFYNININSSIIDNTERWRIYINIEILISHHICVICTCGGIIIVNSTKNLICSIHFVFHRIIYVALGYSRTFLHRLKKVEVLRKWKCRLLIGREVLRK